jgi:hypothetical protein
VRTVKGVDPPKLEISIKAEYVMSSVYANATFGVFTGTFFEEVVFSLEGIQGKGLGVL